MAACQDRRQADVRVLWVRPEIAIHDPWILLACRFQGQKQHGNTKNGAQKNGTQVEVKVANIKLFNIQLVRAFFDAACTTLHP
jgi:hypothetical protein